MATRTELLRRYRLPFLAVLVSTAVHAMMLAGMPRRLESLDETAGAIYSATLDPAFVEPVAAPAPIATAPPQPKRAARKPRPRKAPPPAPATSVEEAAFEPTAAPEPEIVAEATAISTPSAPPPPDEKPEVVALAATEAVPVPEPPAAPAEVFPVEGLPARVQIDYALKSSLADARAVYRWSREGDSYRITGEGEAEGFFALFLEGRMQQESRGTVTAAGLRPERFIEKKPNVEDEGLAFDWPGHTVTFQRGTTKKTTPLTDNTVDWLSMIFQLAHVPPSKDAEAMQLRVFTQRRLYKFDLKVLGIEEINIPLGKVRALHLRHVDPEDKQVVDVWLGVDQHYLPVKMRYPVARNRLIVEQSATRVSSQ